MGDDGPDATGAADVVVAKTPPEPDGQEKTMHRGASLGSPGFGGVPCDRTSTASSYPFRNHGFDSRPCSQQQQPCRLGASSSRADARNPVEDRAEVPATPRSPMGCSSPRSLASASPRPEGSWQAEGREPLEHRGFVEDARLKQRREDRAQQSHAFREWLKRQRAEKKEQPSAQRCVARTEIHCPGFATLASSDVLACHSAVTGEADASALLFADGHEQSPQHRLCSSASGAIGANMTPQQRCRGSSGSKSPQQQALRSVGSETTTAADFCTSERSSSPGSMATATVTGGSTAPAGLSTAGAMPRGSPPMQLTSGKASPLAVATGAAMAEFWGLSIPMHLAPLESDPQTAAPQAEIEERVICTDGGNGCAILPTVEAGEEFSDEQPGSDAERSVSIGDRIEGIRACLEARMGTQRFRKLYRSLASRKVLADTAADASNAASEEPICSAGCPVVRVQVPVDEAFQLCDTVAVDGGDDCGSDLEDLVPLVAKLVACENSYFS
mmetsp:Transcript_32098/g.88707  ORF Transcript_32098/g.88707 Transcript_32098/m.88707 type:complete len:500 (-) Transcript_32098:108-1607(-)